MQRFLRIIVVEGELLAVRRMDTCQVRSGQHQELYAFLGLFCTHAGGFDKGLGCIVNVAVFATA